MAAIELNHLAKRFPGAVVAVNDCTLRVEDGEYLVILGPSGCGKTTLLRLIAGLDRPDAGDIRIDQRDVATAKPHERGIGMIFQDFTLYPHMTIRRNLAFPLRTRNTDSGEIEQRIASISNLLCISTLLDRKPGELSGGERQRAALGRALIIQPRALLLDEPLSHLDTHLREGLRRELKQIHATLKPTVIHVTHDQEEAIEMGRRIAIMAEGRVQQIGTFEELQRRPANRFVAGFLGRPRMNFLMGILRQPNDDRVGVVLERDDSSPLWLPIEHGAVPASAMNREVVIGVRPAALRIVASESQPHLRASVNAIYRRVEGTILGLTLDGAEDELLMWWPADAETPNIGNQISFAWPVEETKFFAPGPYGTLIA
jgi:sn-glycerol 3-phosphate transport system ATP-binding protein